MCCTMFSACVYMWGLLTNGYMFRQNVSPTIVGPTLHLGFVKDTAKLPWKWYLKPFLNFEDIQKGKGLSDV